MIRKATESDFNAIADMGLEFLQCSPYGVASDKDSLIVFAQMCLDQGLLCVAEINGEVVGFAAGTKGPYIGNLNYSVGTEIAWWVNPDHRKGTIGVKLMRFLEKMAKDSGIDFWNMMFLENSMPDVIEGIYQKDGYQKAETNYMKRLH